MQEPDMRGRGMQEPGVTVCGEEKVAFFSSNLFLFSPPPSATHPPSCLSLPRLKDARGSLAVCLPGGDHDWLVGGGFPGRQTLNPHHEEMLPSWFRFSDPEVVFYRERIKPAGLDPCIVSSDREDCHTQGCVYLGVGIQVLSCILVLTTATHCMLCP